MRNTSPTVAIVVLTWNQRELTLDCLASLAELDYPSDRLEIIVVDNGSVDDTAQAIREAHPSVTVLENGENLGFAGGNNVGMRYALETAADYIMLLNNDTIVDRYMLSKLLTVAEGEPSIGIVTPRIYYSDEPTRIWCAGADIDLATGRTWRLRAEEHDNNGSEIPHDVGFASGCAICLKSSVIEDIGLLDSRFFIYYEETDWCMRAVKAGWRIVYVPEAHMWHRISSAMGTSSPATDYYMTRNVFLFLSKHQEGINRLAALARAAALSLLTILSYTARSHQGRRRRNRDARLLALRDCFLHRWGKMGQDVAAICYPEHQ